MLLSKLFSTLQPLTLALLGALCVLAFPFLPVAQGISIEQPVAGQIGFSMYGHEGKTALFPQWNPVNYWQSGLQTYWFVLLSAALAVALAWRKEYRAMLWASLATWGTAFYMLQGVIARMGERSGGWLPQLVPFLKNNFNVQAHLLWGWLVLFIGLLLLVIAAGLPLKASAALRPRSPSLNHRSLSNVWHAEPADLYQVLQMFRAAAVDKNAYGQTGQSATTTLDFKHFQFL